MYSTQPKQLSKMLARQMITWPITSIVCPLIGGYLSTIHLRLPLAISAVIHALAAVLVVPRVPGKRSCSFSTDVSMVAALLSDDAFSKSDRVSPPTL